MFDWNEKLMLVLKVYQKKIEKDFFWYNLIVKYNTFRYHRYLSYFIINKVNKDVNILELGCYNWYWMEVFKLFKYNNILWVDYNDDAIDMWRKRWNNIIKIDLFKSCDIKSMFNRYDYIIMNNVFHDDYFASPEKIRLNIIELFNNINNFLKKWWKVLFNFSSEKWYLDLDFIKEIINIWYIEIESWITYDNKKDLFFVFIKTN